MSSPKDSAIDEELFQFYLQFRLRQIQKSMLLWEDNSDKEALVNILTNCQHINGNTLRMVFRDIFDKSAETFTYAQPPLTTTAANPVVVNAGEKRRCSTSPTKSSTLALEQDEPTPPLDDTDTELEQEEGEASADLDSSGEEVRPKKRRAYSRKSDSSIPWILRYWIRKAASADLTAMLENPQVTKDIFRSRMNVITKTFKIHYTPQRGSDPPKCRFEIFNQFSYKSPMGQCQLSMIAYHLGRIEEIERDKYSLKQARKNRMRYYQDLSVSLNEPKLAHDSHLQEFPRHCERAVYIVRNLGAYVLFMPEVMPPTTYKKIQIRHLLALKAYLEAKCSPFKDIARFNEKDKLIVSPSTGALTKFLEKDNPHCCRRFTAFSL